MATPIRTPRVNSNEDSVKLIEILVDIGSAVRAGDPIIDVETAKATYTVESDADGYLIAVNGQEGEMIAVGAVLAWIGATPTETVPVEAAESSAGEEAGGPTAKALLLLRQYRLEASAVPHAGPRLTADDVKQYLAQRDTGGARPAAPAIPGTVKAFGPEQRAMLRTVTWHRDEAVAAYIEVAYDPAPWKAYAAAFQKEQGLLMDPLLALMSRRLAQLAQMTPLLNATVAADGAFLYERVNLGFTVQADATLYLVVVKDAARISELDFVRELGGLQRTALKHRLRPEQTTEATVSFSSMARWNVTRHVPVLPPQTALIVAHTAAINGTANLGATYDHRLLTGFDVVQALRELSRPPEPEGS